MIPLFAFLIIDVLFFIAIPKDYQLNRIPRLYWWVPASGIYYFLKSKKL